MAIVKVKNLASEPDKRLVICPKCGNKGELVLFRPFKQTNINHKLGLDDGQVALSNGERLQIRAPTWEALEFCCLNAGEWEHLVPSEKKMGRKTARKSILSLWEEISDSKASSTGSSKKGRKPRPRMSTHKS